MSNILAGHIIRLLVLGLLLGTATISHAAAFSEDAVKAAFLHRFGAYVHWPQPLPPDSPFVIGVVGASGVAEQLEQSLPQLTIQNRRARVRRIASSRELDDVHVLYIGPGEQRRSRTFLNAAIGNPVLVVTDDSRGIPAGGIINFVRVGRNIRFEVSLHAAERSGLRLDSGLLAVATQVER